MTKYLAFSLPVPTVGPALSIPNLQYTEQNSVDSCHQLRRGQTNIQDSCPSCVFPWLPSRRGEDSGGPVCSNLGSRSVPLQTPLHMTSRRICAPRSRRSSLSKPIDESKQVEVPFSKSTLVKTLEILFPLATFRITPQPPKPSPGVKSTKISIHLSQYGHNHDPLPSTRAGSSFLP